MPTAVKRKRGTRGIVGLKSVKAKNIGWLLKNAYHYLPGNKFARLISTAANSKTDGSFVQITKGLHYDYNNNLHFDVRVMINYKQQHLSDLHVYCAVVPVPKPNLMKINQNGSVTISNRCGFKAQMMLVQITGF